AEGEVGDQVLADRNAAKQFAFRRDDVDAGRVVEIFTRAAAIGDAGGDPEVAFDVEFHAIAAAPFAEVEYQFLAREFAVFAHVKGPDLAVAAGLRVAVDHVERLGVGRDGDAVRPVEFLVGEDAGDFGPLNPIHAFYIHLHGAAIRRVIRVGEPDAAFAV